MAVLRSALVAKRKMAVLSLHMVVHDLLLFIEVEMKTVFAKMFVGVSAVALVLVAVVVVAMNGSAQRASASPADANAARKNVAVSFAGAHEDGDGLWIDSCIKLPSNKDWLPEASLLVDGKFIASNGWDMKNAKDTINKGASDRCYSFLFQGVTAQAVQSSKNSKLVVQRLKTGAPEGVSEADFKAEQVEGPWDAGIE